MQRLAVLKEIGFNRLSFGVQDFDPDVQKAVHREQPAEQVFDLVAARANSGFQSVNVDLIYGLPKQNPRIVCSHAGTGDGVAARSYCAVCLCALARALQATAPYLASRLAISP